eukprot:Hpha_TRINITY_DN36444_c0_g1::TRINITY_DN36444_c0_g1_i1::g.20041::m.20041
MHGAVVALGVLCTGLVDKEVVYTSWWPPGTEKQAESVGILSRGMLYMTGMMEQGAGNLTNETILEYSDVRDIMVGGNATPAPDALVSCLVNAPQGARRVVAREWAGLLGEAVALTVVEMAGEWSFFNTSASCVAVQPGGAAKSVHRHPSGRVVAVEGGAGVRRLTHVTAEGSTPEEVLREVAETVGGLEGLAECTAYVQEATAGEELHSTLRQRGVAVTTLSVGKGQPGVILRCTGGMHQAKERLESVPGVFAVKQGGLVHVEGIGAALANGTDAFTKLETVLKSANTAMENVLRCHFYASNISIVPTLFQGFYQVFNVDAYPPPARTEFVARHSTEQVTVQCVAAAPIS